MVEEEAWREGRGSLGIMEVGGDVGGSAPGWLVKAIWLVVI